MIGKKLSPRIRGVQHQRLYRIDETKKYGSLASLVSGKDRLIRIDWIEEQWERRTTAPAGAAAYGKRGCISVSYLQAQRNTCSCLTLIIACIIYWQAKEITQIIATYGHELDEKCLTLLPHVSPIGWDNIILYGEYMLDRSLIK